ncbi:tryptophan-rich sensory protein [Mycobacterium conspicuum]|uniref:Tryptophan-rich sensory protein n=1 Tax=Mycobacterium conspicuum TaxID=44010 RepID=A0A7I7YB86_9MYCO|nr:tryptophan-rich sensory protein [Mycobacterium conspicuum]
MVKPTVKPSTLAATSLAVAAAAGTGSIASPARAATWYARIRKPTYQPPAVVFPVMWTTLYADIAATSALALDRLRASGRDTEARRYAAALGVNLGLNAGWSWLFFRYHKLGASALGAAVLTASSADLARRTARADPRAGAAQSLYPLWGAFATFLSAHIWRLNRGMR